jgi:precorrin-6B methylase 2
LPFVFLPHAPPNPCSARDALRDVTLKIRNYRVRFNPIIRRKDMKASRFVRRLLLASFLSLISGGVFAQAQPAKEEYKPQVGQKGKDVIWVPTPQTLVDKMLDMAKVMPQDYVIDLGSGDGRMVITAAKRGARALGIEYNPDLVELSKRNAAKEGVGEKARFVKGDLFESDFSQATVLAIFLLPEMLLKLRPKILDMKPGTRIVANSYTMGEWQGDSTATVTTGCTDWCTAYLWIVPAKVAGTWKLPQGELSLKQEFQMISGSLNGNGKNLAITDGKMRGDQISFSAGAAQYTGRVNGNTMSGTVKGGNGGNWTATRAGR